MSGIYLKASLVALAVLGIFAGYYYSQDSGQLYRHQVIDELEQSGFKNVKLQDYLRKNDFELEHLRGKAFILNFWATWCEPCAKEIPDMIKLIEHFDGKLALVAISSDEEASELDAFINAFGGLKKENVYILRDPEQSYNEVYGVNLLPESFIFYPNGKLSRKIVGFIDWYNDSSLRFMEEVVNYK